MKTIPANFDDLTKGMIFFVGKTKCIFFHKKSVLMRCAGNNWRTIDFDKENPDWTGLEIEIPDPCDETTRVEVIAKAADPPCQPVELIALQVWSMHDRMGTHTTISLGDKDSAKGIANEILKLAEKGEGEG